MNNKRTIQLVVAVCLASVFLAVPLLGACAEPAPAETIELVLTTPFPTSPCASTDSFVWWIEEVEKRTASKGHPVHIDVKWGGALAATMETLDAVKSGLADMGFCCWGYFNATMALQNVGSNWAPFIYDCPQACVKAWWQLYDEFPEIEAEYTSQNLKMIWHEGNPNYHLSSVDKPIRSLEDMKGLKVGSGVKALNQVFGAAGATGVPIPSVERYDALSKGVIDVVGGGLDLINKYKYYEVCKYVNLVGLGSAASTVGVCVNLDTWNKLPEDVKKVMLEVGEEATEVWAEKLDDEMATLEDFLKGQGMEFIEFPAADRERWKNHPDTIAVKDMWLDMCKEQGKSGQKILDRYSELETEMVKRWCK